jgi:hypothetical protein
MADLSLEGEEWIAQSDRFLQGKSPDYEDAEARIALIQRFFKRS